MSSHDDFSSRDVASLEDSKINMVSSSSSSSSSSDKTSSLPGHSSKSLGLIDVSLLSVEHDHLVEEDEDTSVLSTSKQKVKHKHDSRKKTKTFLHDPTKKRDKRISKTLSHDSKPKKIQKQKKKKKDHSFLAYMTRKKDPIRREDDFVKHVYMSLSTTTKRRSVETNNSDVSELSASEVAPQLPSPDHSVENKLDHSVPDHSVENKTATFTSESEEDEQLVPDKKTHEKNKERTR